MKYYNWGDFMDYVPPCKQRRTLFNILKVFSCNECKFLDCDEYYVIGDLNLNIYYINNKCILNGKSEDPLKLKILLKDAINCNNDNLIVWLDKFDFGKDESLIYDLLSFDLDVQIIVNC